jgi:hypothetical protein
MRRVVQHARVDNLEAMFQRHKRLEADNESAFQDYGLSSCWLVEAVSGNVMVVTVEPAIARQLALQLNQEWAQPHLFGPALYIQTEGLGGILCFPGSD